MQRQRDNQSRSDEELATLKESKESQQQDFEYTIKHKTDAFTKVQDELQRMLDEAIVQGKEKVDELQEARAKLESDFALQMKEKTDAFTKAQDEMQRLLNKSETKIEEVSLCWIKISFILI